MEEETKRLRATPEEFERLLRGETVSLSLEGGMEKNCLEKFSENIGHISVFDLEVDSVCLEGNYPFSIDLSGNSKINWLGMKSVNIENLNFFENPEIGGIRIFGDSQVSNLQIGGKSTVKNLHFTDSAIIGKLELFQTPSIERVSLSDYSKINRLYITGVLKIDLILLTDAAQITRAIFTENCLLNQLEILGQSRIADLSASRGACIDKFLMSEESEVGHLKFFMCKQIGKLHFHGGVIRHSCQISHLNTQSLIIMGRGSIFPKKLFIDKVRCHSLRFTDCHLATTLRMTDVGPLEKGKGFLEFTRSSFDKIEMIGNKFEGFSFLAFENSDITKTFIAETDFPQEIKSINTVGKTNYYAIKPKQVKLFNEQLKIIHQNQGNRTEALTYQARELDAHYSELKWEKHFWDKMTLAFNKYTTNFGTSWVKGVLMLFVIGLLMYNWLIIFIAPQGNALLVLKEKYFSEFVEFMNPASHIWKKWGYIYELNGLDADISTDVLPAGIKAWLLFCKVVIVTLIYQTVQAFRKFGKK